MESLIPLIIQLIGGGAGGNIVSAVLKNLDLSKVIATVVGLIGGVGGGQIAKLIPALEGLLQGGGGGSILANGGASAVGGALLTAIVGFIKKAMAAKG